MLKNVGLVSLGCDKNLMDSEVMLGLLRENGYDLVTDKDNADIIIINTCGFILDAEKESYGEIEDAVERKRNGSCKLIVATGCLIQRYRDAIFEEFPEIDAIVGASAFDCIIDVIKEAESNAEGESLMLIEDIDRSIDEEIWQKRVVSTGSHYAYIKIAEGCNNRCAYCTIPSIRGKYRSRTMESILKEAKTLVQSGVKEIVLVAQDTSLYGIDLYKKACLHELLRALTEISGLLWVRIMYCYPEHITDELIAEIRDNEKVAKYIDMPIQHSVDSVLKRMKRRSTHDELCELIYKLREEIPEIVLRTTLIVGFPGESKDDFEGLLEFVEDMEFNKLGVFEYSRELGTPAHDMPNQVNENQKKARKNRIMKLQNDISEEKLEQYVGREYKVIVDSEVEVGVYFARGYMDAPTVDGGVFVKSEKVIKPGDVINVLITDTAEYDLFGVIADGD